MPPTSANAADRPGVTVLTVNKEVSLYGENLKIEYFEGGILQVLRGSEVAFVSNAGDWRRAWRHPAPVAPE